MQGVIRLINSDDGLVAAETEHGEYTVFGLMGDYEVHVGDIVTGPLEALDEQRVTNETQDVAMLVYIEDIELSLEQAQEKLA
jgi:hypothetical protein